MDVCVYIYIIFDELMSACANGMCVCVWGGVSCLCLVASHLVFCNACVDGVLLVMLLVLLSFAAKTNPKERIKKNKNKKTFATTGFSVTVTVPSFIASINGSSVVATVTLIRKELSVAINPLKV